MALDPNHDRSSVIVAFAPGRVNLVGDHTDTTGGLCLPMAVSMGITITGRRQAGSVSLTSDDADGRAEVALDIDDPTTATPPWARYVAGVVTELRPDTGFIGTTTSDLAMGAGLSSSAALEVAVALALGHDGTPLELAEICQRAEQRATGVPCGILDQLASAGGVEGHALLMDCHTRTLEAVAVPADLEFVVVHSGQERTLVGSAYALRRHQCEAAQEIIGPLRSATVDDIGGIDDAVLRRRARHVVTENQRVRDAVVALRTGDATTLGELFTASHRSLRDDFENSTAIVDATVDRLCALRGVFGARMTGGGWGGCVVAVSEPGAIDEGWVVRPGAGAQVTTRADEPSGR